MADSQINQISQYEIKSLIISKGNIEIDIRSIFVEMNIYDSVLLNTISGNLIIVDSLGSLRGFQFDGSEYLIVQMSKNNDLMLYEKVFHIHKQSKRDMQTLGSESYQLDFISDEYSISQQTKVSQHFEDTYSNIAKLILKNYLNVFPAKLKGVIDNSHGIRSVIIPTMKPLDAITWCSKRALDTQGKPTFLFFENADGFNFTTTSNIFKQKPLVNINFSPKNIMNDMNIEFFGVRDFEILDQYDFIENTKSGVYAKTGRFYDIINRVFKEIRTTYTQDQNGVDSANPKKTGVIPKTNRFNRTPEEYYYSKIESYFYNSNPTGNEETPDKWLLQREAIMQNLFAKKVRVTMAGNFELTSGKTLNVIKPKHSVRTDNEGTGLDLTITGKYLIVATRHTVKSQKGDAQQHTTSMDLVTDSTLDIKE